MATVAGIVEALEDGGVVFRVVGGREVVAEAGGRVAPEAALALEELKARTEELMHFLRARSSDLPEEDGYAAALMASVRRSVERPGLPAGLLPWLRGASPRLHADLTSRLPDLVQRLWAARAPMSRFDAVLAEMEECYARAFGFYAACSADGGPE